MQDFEKWWEEQEFQFIDPYGPYHNIAKAGWDAATERAARIAEEPGWKCEDVCPDDCTNAKYIAQKIRME